MPFLASVDDAPTEYQPKLHEQPSEIDTRRTKIFIGIYSNQPNPASESCHRDSLRNDEILDVLAVCIDTFEATAITRSINSIRFQFQNLLDRISMREVDGYRPDGLSSSKTLWDVVYAVYSDSTS